jgi:hypothetical protein
LTFFRLKRHRCKYAGLIASKAELVVYGRVPVRASKQRATMDDDLRRKLKELSTSMQSRADELALPGGNTDISALMSGIAVTLEASRYSCGARPCAGGSLAASIVRRPASLSVRMMPAQWAGRVLALAAGKHYTSTNRRLCPAADLVAQIFNRRATSFVAIYRGTAELVDPPLGL